MAERTDATAKVLRTNKHIIEPAISRSRTLSFPSSNSPNLICRRACTSTQRCVAARIDDGRLAVSDLARAVAVRRLTPRRPLHFRILSRCRLSHCAFVVAFGFLFPYRKLVARG